jgi:hypothetical protein
VQFRLSSGILFFVDWYKLLIAVMMEVVSFYETSVNFYQTTWRKIPEHTHFQIFLSPVIFKNRCIELCRNVALSVVLFECQTLPIAVRKVKLYRLRVVECKMTRGLLELKREVEAGGWRELPNLCATKYD